MSSVSKYNKHYEFIKIDIDIFTKYAWAIPLKNKSASSIIICFRKSYQKDENQKSYG